MLSILFGIFRCPDTEFLNSRLFILGSHHPFHAIKITMGITYEALLGILGKHPDKQQLWQ